MVRSSTLGYMAMLNRRCVAQSRAKCGLYYVGNLKLFGPASVKKNILADDEDDDNDESQRSNVWTGMVKNMLDEGRVGNTIIAHCPKHPDSSRHEIRAPGDFFSLIKKDAGMCDTPCGKDMPCGEHKCHRPCSSRFHNHVTCRTIVQDICLAGEHDIERKCYENRGDILCHVKVPFTFNCGQGHTGHKKCYMDPGDKSLRCKRRCGLPMDCGIEGHTCRNKCGDAHDHSYCSAKVKASVPSCDSVPKHMIDKECSGIIDESFPCTKKIRTILDREHCQHTVEKLCSQADIDVSIEPGKIMNFQTVWDFCFRSTVRKFAARSMIADCTLAKKLVAKKSTATTIATTWSSLTILADIQPKSKRNVQNQSQDCA